MSNDKIREAFEAYINENWYFVNALKPSCLSNRTYDANDIQYMWQGFQAGYSANRAEVAQEIILALTRQKENFAEQYIKETGLLPSQITMHQQQTDSGIKVWFEPTKQEENNHE